MKWMFQFLVLLTFAQALNAQKSEWRSLEAFKDLSASAGIQVTLINSDETKAFIETSAKSLDQLKTEVHGDVLKISWKSGKGNNRTAKVDLYFKEIEKIKVSSGASVKSDECITSDEINISASSGASIDLDIYTDSSSLSVSSGAHIVLEGITNKFSCSSSSGAYFKGLDLISEEVTISASSGASTSIFVSQKLVASASSGGSVKYDGDPEEVDLNVGKYSGGSVRKI